MQGIDRQKEESIISLVWKLPDAHPDGDPFAIVKREVDERAGSTGSEDVKPIRFWSDGKRQYKCSQCDFTRVSRCAVITHIGEHHSDSVWSCPCGYKTISAIDVDLHTAKCTYVVPHGCKHCSYKTTRISNVRRHMERKHKSMKTVTLA